ncbi:HNH endonuclease [Xanthobacter flavus]|uniref:HNH endonuclease n=1 Tax=Xanthobacter flavus TaxID=281 RepID=UPI00372694FE
MGQDGARKRAHHPFRERPTNRSGIKPLGVRQHFRHIKAMSKLPRLSALPSRLSALPSALPVQAHDGTERSRQRDADAPWRAWYKTAAWERKRQEVFARDLYQCQRAECGRIIVAPHERVCDHRRPHRGDPALFWDDGNLQTLCKACHDGAKQAEERRAAR